MLYRLSGLRNYIIDLFGTRDRIYDYTIHEGMYVLKIHDSYQAYLTRV